MPDVEQAPPKTSVTNSFGQTHEGKNLFLVHAIGYLDEDIKKGNV